VKEICNKSSRQHNLPVFTDILGANIYDPDSQSRLLVIVIVINKGVSHDHTDNVCLKYFLKSFFLHS
jgi:hypothetical protein